MTTNELEMTLPTSSAKETNNNAIGPGSRLRKVREAKHLTVNEMAKRIRLNPERLFQLENDDYLLMGAPAFAKGYLRAYASQLGIDKEEILTILQAFDDLGLAANIQHNKPELIHEKIVQGGPKITRWVSYLIVALLLSLLAYLWYGHFNNINKTTGTDKPTEAVETTTPLPDPTNNQISTSTPQKLDSGVSPAESISLDPKTNISKLNAAPPADSQTVNSPVSSGKANSTDLLEE